ncbi:DUF1365 domain-containing protein [Pseudonocardia ailaonensis]|uniref:DUF1365 domain-containing protein n=1 Tax=Pseudonocardia ailaonensis TaxID=367279 RepID=A0ABN2MK29_9PSEU
MVTPVSGDRRRSDDRHSRPELYESVVRHKRRESLDYSFSHRTYLWLVDLDHLPSYGPLARFESRDHLGDPALSLRENVDAYLAEGGIDLRGGRILMLANARCLGHVFNPLSVFWCHRDTGELACVIAEVHNTYGGRHRYLLPAERADVDKAFYVSPFFAVDGGYHLSLPIPDDALKLAITLRRNDATALTATVTGTRRTATPRALARQVLRRPFVTHTTSALIRFHGIRLWRKGLPVVARHSQEGVR